MYVSSAPTATCSFCSLLMADDIWPVPKFSDNDLDEFWTRERGCTCPSLTDEADQYPEQLALTPPSEIMSASENYERSITDIAQLAESSRLYLPNLGYDDGASFPQSLFAAAETLPFGRSFDSLRGDHNWLNFAEQYLSGHVKLCDFADKQIRRAIDDNATMTDWSPTSGAHLYHYEQARQRECFRGVTEPEMTEMITGLNSTLATKVIAEGQFVRVMLSARDHSTRMAAFKLWSYAILRLDGASALEEVMNKINGVKFIHSEIAACAVGRSMHAAFKHVTQLHVAMSNAWMYVIDEVFEVRQEVLQGMQYDVAVCGLHPPTHCVTDRVVQKSNRLVVSGGKKSVLTSPPDWESSDDDESESDSDGEIMQNNGEPFVNYGFDCSKDVSYSVGNGNVGVAHMYPS